MSDRPTSCIFDQKARLLPPQQCADLKRGLEHAWQWLFRRFEIAAIFGF
jgi:hypothetical protein